MTTIDQWLYLHPQVVSVISSIVLLWIFSGLATQFHIMDMAHWLNNQRTETCVSKRIIFFKEGIFGLFLIIVLNSLLLYTFNLFNVGDKARFEMNTDQMLVSLMIGSSIYPIIIWHVFRKHVQGNPI